MGRMREADRAFLAVGLLCAAVLVVYAVMAPRAKPSSSRILENLESTEIRLPFHGVIIEGPHSIPGSDPHVVGAVGASSRSERTRYAEGSTVVLGYYVYDSRASADAVLRELTAGEDDARVPVTRLDLGIPYPSICYEAGDAFCKVLVGPVLIDVSSRFVFLGRGDDTHLRELVEVAIRQLKAAQPTGLDV